MHGNRENRSSNLGLAKSFFDIFREFKFAKTYLSLQYKRLFLPYQDKEKTVLEWNGKKMSVVFSLL